VLLSPEALHSAFCRNPKCAELTAEQETPRTFTTSQEITPTPQQKLVSLLNLLPPSRHGLFCPVLRNWYHPSTPASYPAAAALQLCNPPARPVPAHPRADPPIFPRAVGTGTTGNTSQPKLSRRYRFEERFVLGHGARRSPAADAGTPAPLSLARPRVTVPAARSGLANTLTASATPLQWQQLQLW